MYKLKKVGDAIHPCLTPRCRLISSDKGGFILLTQSSVAYAAMHALRWFVTWRAPTGGSMAMRKRRSKKYKPTRVHKPWQKLNDFQDTG